MKSLVLVILLVAVSGARAQDDIIDNQNSDELRPESCSYLEYNNPACDATLPDPYEMDPLQERAYDSYNEGINPYYNEPRVDALDNEGTLGEDYYNYEEFYDYEEFNSRQYDYEDPYDMRRDPSEDRYESQRVDPLDRNNRNLNGRDLF